MSLSKASSVPAGRAAKAASVGAKTVNGPVPDKVPARPGTARTAVSRVLWSGLPTIMSTTVCALTANENNAAVKSVKIFFMSFDLFNWFNVAKININQITMFTKSDIMLNKIREVVIK